MYACSTPCGTWNPASALAAKCVDRESRLSHNPSDDAHECTDGYWNTFSSASRAGSSFGIFLVSAWRHAGSNFCGPTMYLTLRASL